MSIIEQVTDIVHTVTKIPTADLSPDADLRIDFNVDSLLGLQIIARLEKQFGVRVPDEDLDSYTTIREAANLVDLLSRDVAA